MNTPESNIRKLKRPFANEEQFGLVKKFNKLCKLGRLYDVQKWIVEGKPIQMDPAVHIEEPYLSALDIAIKTGQHSLCQLLLESGFQLDHQNNPSLLLAFECRRKDLVDLLVEHGADLRRVGPRLIFERD